MLIKARTTVESASGGVGGPARQISFAQHPVVFLDINGVLQPNSSQERFKHDLEGLKARLVAEVDPGYQALDHYDIAAVQYDWYPPAVANLKALCQRTGARVVVSSDWREGKTLEQLKLLFRIHGLDSLIDDKTAESHCSRDLQIHDYLTAHPEIEGFVILDDGYRDELRRRFPDTFVHTPDHFDARSFVKALRILRRQRARRAETLG